MLRSRSQRQLFGCQSDQVLFADKREGPEDKRDRRLGRTGTQAGFATEGVCTRVQVLASRSQDLTYTLKDCSLSLLRSD